MILHSVMEPHPVDSRPEPRPRRKQATSRVFRQRLRRARAQRGLSQAELAVRTGLQQSALSHYESGARRPSFTNLRRLASALDVSTDYLVGHAPKRQQDGDLTAQIARLRPADRELVRALVAPLLRK